jgi:hypothetical protein
VIAEIVGEQPRIEIVAAPRPEADDHGDGLAAVEIGFIGGAGRAQCQERRCGQQGQEALCDHA